MMIYDQDIHPTKGLPTYLLILKVPSCKHVGKNKEDHDFVCQRLNYVVPSISLSRWRSNGHEKCQMK